MKKTLFTIIVICLTHFANAQNYTLYQNIQYDTISGVDTNLLSLDIYKPTSFSGNRPVLIYIHGGYWRTGDKSSVGYSATLFTDSGYVFVSINYRLSPYNFDTISTTAVRFPVHPQDCANALAWVFNNISNYSGDTSKVSLIGHSAGAQLVMLLSTNKSFLQNAGIPLSKIKCTCSLDCGVFDLIEEFQQAGSNESRRVPLLNAFGNDPSLYDDASPQYFIYKGKPLPWFHLVHQNVTDRIYANSRFRDSLNSNSYKNVTLFNANPYDHGQIASMLGNIQDSIGETQSIMTFFGNCLASNITTTISKVMNPEQHLTIYPNPAKSTLFIQGQTENISQYEIVNIFGHTLQSGMISNGRIDVSSLQKGIYFIQFKDAKAGVFVTKFFKE